MPSIDRTVARSSRSVRAWSAWTTHSPPDFVDDAYWNGVALSTTDDNCWEIVRATKRRMMSPATMPDGAIGFLQRGHASKPHLPWPNPVRSARTWSCPHDSPTTGANVQMSSLMTHCTRAGNAEILREKIWIQHEQSTTSFEQIIGKREEGRRVHAELRLFQKRGLPLSRA